MNDSTSLPLTEVTYFILLSLAPGARHGYAIMKDVRFISQGRISLSTGTLYGGLKRLLNLGWITRSDNSSSVVSGRVRKSYRLTALGRSLLAAEIERLESLLEAANLRTTGEGA